MESNNYMISYMNVIDITELEQFGIIIYSKVDLSFIIYHLIYLTFLVNLLNQSSQLTYIKLATLLTCNILSL